MKVENPVALRFILQDELYLLNTDKSQYAERAAAMAEEIQTHPPVTAIESEPQPPLTDQPQPFTIPVIQPLVKTPEPAFNYLGGNLKHFLVLVHYPDVEFIDEAHLAALTNIIKRKELGIADIAILNMATRVNTNLTELKQFFKPAKVLLLGNSAIPQGMPSIAQNVISSSATLAALYSFSFDEMMDDTDKKKAFWEQMKSL